MVQPQAYASVLVIDGIILTLAWDGRGWRFHEWELPGSGRNIAAVDDLDRRRSFNSIDLAREFFREKYKGLLPMRLRDKTGVGVPSRRSASRHT
jgi:hypothetical protein